MKILASTREFPTYSDYLASMDFTASQLQEISYGFRGGLSPKKMSIIANPKLQAEQMAILIGDLLGDISFNTVLLYASPEFNLRQTEYLSQYAAMYVNSKFHNYNVLMEMADPDYTVNQMQAICVGRHRGLSDAQMAKVLDIVKKNPLTYSQIDILIKAIAAEVPDACVDFLVRSHLHMYQGIEVILGYVSGLSDDDVQFYARPDVDSERMFMLRRCLKAGRSHEELTPYLTEPLYKLKDFCEEQNIDIQNEDEYALVGY